MLDLNIIYFNTNGLGMQAKQYRAMRTIHLSLMSSAQPTRASDLDHTSLGSHSKGRPNVFHQRLGLRCGSNIVEPASCRAMLDPLHAKIQKTI